VVVTFAAGEVMSDSVETDCQIANDVLLVSDTTMTLVESPLSVLAYGRRPGGSLQVGSITDTVILDQIGAAFLTGKTNPLSSRVSEVVPTFDLDCEPGDTITVEGDVLRVAEMAFSLDQATGRLRKVPVLTSAYELDRQRGQRTVERLIAANGNSSASATIIDRGTQVASGPINPTELESWSWTDGADLDVGWWDVAEENPQAWQPHIVKKQCRMVAIRVLCEWAEPDGADGIAQVTTGETKFRLKVNSDVLWQGIPFVVTVPEINPVDDDDPEVYGLLYVLGEGTLNVNDVVSVAPELNGEHINGSVQLLAVDVS
jgi:hypothetical protein